MKWLAIIVTTLFLAGCEIDMVYLDENLSDDHTGLSFSESRAHDLSRTIGSFEQLALLPEDIAYHKEYYLDDGGSDFAITPILEILNIVGLNFFDRYDWEQIQCSQVTKNHHDESEQFGWEEEGNFVAKWDASDCYNHDDYFDNDPYLRANLDSYVTWHSDGHLDEIDQLTGLTKLNWRFDIPAGTIQLFDSTIRSRLNTWGDITTDIDLLFHIENDRHQGLLSIKTIEPLVFSEDRMIATDGWIQIETKQDTLDIYILENTVRLIMNGHWLEDY